MANVGKVGRGSWNAIFVIITIAKRAVSCIPANDTFEEVYKVLCQSLNGLASGLFPERSIFNCGARIGEPSDLDAEMSGRPPCNGEYIGFLFCTCADLDAATSHWNLPHYGSHRFCHRCDAEQLETALNFRDCRPSAPRLRTIKAGCAHMLAAHVLWTSIMHLCVASCLGDIVHGHDEGDGWVRFEALVLSLLEPST